MPVFDPGVPWLRGTATLTNGSTTVTTDGVITLNEILEGDRLYVMDGGQRIGPLEIVGGEGDEIELREPFEGATGSYPIIIDRNPVTPLGAKILRDMSDVLGRIGNFGELSERDQIAADLIPIGPERDAIKDALDITKRASNLSDLTNLKEARANLGTFSSVADVQNSHIPAVLESIRTNGFSRPDDASGAQYYRKLAPEADLPGDIVSADGARWGLVGRDLSIAVFGAVGDGVSDDTAAFDAARQFYEIVGGGTLRLQEDATYLIDGWDLHSVENLRVLTNGARFIDLAESTGVFARIGPNSEIDFFKYFLPAGKTRLRVMGVNQTGARLGGWEIVAYDQQPATTTRDGAITINGDYARVGSGKVENWDHPYIISADGVTAGRLEFRRYVRGVWIDEYQRFIIDDVICSERSPNASFNAGNNGLLITGASHGYISRVDVEDAGEHGVRFGGGNGGTDYIHIGRLRSHNSDGCGLKLRPNENETHRNITIDVVQVSDCGTTWGPNQEGVLVERSQNCRIGYLHVHAVNNPYSCARGLRVNSTTGLYVTDALIEDCEDHAILLENTDGASSKNLTQIHIKADIQRPVQDGVVILTDGIQLRAIYLDITARQCGEWAMRITGSGSFNTQSSFTVRSSLHGDGILSFSEDITGEAYCAFDLYEDTLPVQYKASSSGRIKSFRSPVGGPYSEVARILANGNIENANNSYGSISDARLKDAVEASGSQWNDIKALQVRKFINRLNGEQQIGLIAQEVEQVSPGLVSYADDEDTLRTLQGIYPDMDEQELVALAAQGPIASLKYSVLNLKLLKVVQELQERVEMLEGPSS